MKKTITFLSALFFTGALIAQIPTNGLQVHYNFNGNTTDLSGNNLDLTTVGTIYTSSGAPGDSALTNYDAPETFLDYTGDEVNFENQNFTVFAKYYPTPTYKLYSNIFEFGSPNGTHIYLRVYNSGSDWYLQAGHYNATTSTGNNAQAFFGSYLADYHVITMTTEYDPTTTFRNINLYVDGALLHSANFNMNTLINYTNASPNLQILGRSGTSTMNALGNLDEFMYYNRFMDSTEIASVATLSLADMNENLIFSASPNPTSGMIHLSELPQNAQITVVNQTGQVLLTSSTYEAMKQLDLSDLNSGIYFIQVQTENGEIATQKIIKQ